MAVTAPALDDQRAAVVSKAVLRAAEALGLKARRLATIIGTSEPTLSRLKAGGYARSADGVWTATGKEAPAAGEGGAKKKAGKRRGRRKKSA